ncbi:MAG: hypothetical protein ACI8XX_000560 [Polaribacter sp.]|jgi:hypothetical protein
MKIMKINKRIASIATGLLISVSSSIAIADAKSDAVSACGAAESSRKAAAQVQMEWTTTGKLIKAAKKAIEKGDFDKAIKACNKAKFQGEVSVKQAAIEAVAWKLRVPQ